MSSAKETNPDEASMECKPLLRAATNDLFRKNAFRITGLSVDTTARDIAKHAEKLKVLAELGQNPHVNEAFPLRPSPTVEDIREAIQKLKDPEKRLIDEFFWFWPQNFGESRSDAGIQALERGDLKGAFEIWMSKRKHPIEGVVATHNLALIFHIRALDWENHALKAEIDAERRAKVTKYWETAFYRWERIVANEQLWEKVVARIHQLNEPQFRNGFARRMRASLPMALDKVNAELAIAFAESGKLEPALLHVQLMRATSEGSAAAEKTAELVLTPARKRVTEQIRQVKERADKDPDDAITVARQLLEHVRAPLALFDLFFDKFDKHSDFRNDVFDGVAEICDRLQVTYYNATNDNETCLEFLKVVLPFAASTDVREQIEKNIATLKSIAASKKLEPIYELLKSIQDGKVPTERRISRSIEHPYHRLRRFEREVAAAIDVAARELADHSAEKNELLESVAIVLRGISLEAWNTYQDGRTAAQANLLALKYAVSAELKQRLAEDKATLVQHKTQQREERRKSLIGILIFVAFGVGVAVLNQFSSSSSNQSSSAQYSAPSTLGNGNSGDSVYRTPNSPPSNLDLDREKTEIESERAELQSLESQVQDFGQQIRRDRRNLDPTNEFEVDAYNAKIRRYNALVQQYESARAAFNQKVDNYNEKRRAYSR
jgi:hypothetical protein